MYHELLHSNFVTMICCIHKCTCLLCLLYFQSTKVVFVFASSSNFLLELMQAVYKVRFILDEFTHAECVQRILLFIQSCSKSEGIKPKGEAYTPLTQFGFLTTAAKAGATLSSQYEFSVNINAVRVLNVYIFNESFVRVKLISRFGETSWCMPGSWENLK